MISEDQQDQAALYALGLLDADEAAGFERALAADGELRALTEELREAVASLAWTDADTVPPAGLKGRVLARITEETRGNPAEGKVIAGPGHAAAWQPWLVATAAALVFCCALLGVEFYQSHQRMKAMQQLEASQRRRAQTAEAELAANQARPIPDAVGGIVYCALAPVPAPPPAGPQAAVLWDAAQRRGRLQIQKLPPPEAGKDYQLWAVEEGHKIPVDAGVVKVDADGVASVDFRPGAGDDAQARVLAFALSLERAGGVPQNEGPILFAGQLPP